MRSVAFDDMGYLFASCSEYDGQVQIRNFDEHLVELKELRFVRTHRVFMYECIYLFSIYNCMDGWMDVAMYVSM